MKIPCGKCNKGPISESDKVYCDICRVPFHDVCVGITRQEAACLRVKDRKITFFCGNCNVIDTMKKLKEDIEILRLEINELKNDKQQVIPQQRNPQLQHDTNIDSQQLITEVEERKRRAKNLIIYNIKESSKTIGAERQQEDNDTVKSTLAKISDVNTIDIKAFRIGKLDPTKTRPIRVVLNSEADVTTILKCKNKITNIPNIKFASDRTKMQQEHLRNLIGKLNDMTAQGIADRKIKYVRGVPTIVDSSKN